MKKIIVLSAFLVMAMQTTFASDANNDRAELLDQLAQKQALLADLDRRIIELDDANVAMLNKVVAFTQSVRDKFKAKMLAEKPNKEINIEELKYRYISEMVRIDKASFKENEEIIIDTVEKRRAWLFKFYSKKYDINNIELDQVLLEWEKLFNEICDIKNKLILIEA